MMPLFSSKLVNITKYELGWKHFWAKEKRFIYRSYNNIRYLGSHLIISLYSLMLLTFHAYETNTIFHQKKEGISLQKPNRSTRNSVTFADLGMLWYRFYLGWLFFLSRVLTDFLPGKNLLHLENSGDKVLESLQRSDSGVVINTPELHGRLAITCTHVFMYVLNVVTLTK